jgi:putative transposase
MNNHIHILIREKRDKISRIMSRIRTSYAWWYNRKYDRSGHLFQGRYGSECVEDDAYLLTVVRYIHNNPVKANMVRAAEDYRWSSIHAYYDCREYPAGLTEPEFVLGIIHEKAAEAIKGFRELMQQGNEDQCLDYHIKLRKTDSEVKAEIEAIMNGEPIEELLKLEKSKRQEILQKIKKSEGVTQRQIACVRKQKERPLASNVPLLRGEGICKLKGDFMYTSNLPTTHPVLVKCKQFTSVFAWVQVCVRRGLGCTGGWTNTFHLGPGAGLQ